MADYKVVDIEQLEAGLTATADAIRAKTGATEKIPWDSETGMAANIEEVFDAGKKAKYDVFWDAFQTQGKRTTYEAAFANGWSDDCFYPKYDIALKDSPRVFQWSQITNLVGKLASLGRKLDSSGNTMFTQMFQGSKIIHVPEIDMRKATNTSFCFGSGAKVETIDKLIVSETTPFGDNNCFQRAEALRNIIFEGIIGMSIDLHWSPLTKNSIISIIQALSDATSDQTASFSQKAVNNAFETTEGAADGSTSEEWLTLTATKSNWTISLA